MPTIRQISLPAFARRVAELGEDLEEAITRGLHAAALRLEGLVVEEIDSAEPFPAVDRGELRNSVSSVLVDGEALVAVDAPHAGIIEDGTRPFFPPIAPIAEWVLRKGIADTEAEAKRIAFAIAKKFSEEGIAPRNYFAKAFSRFTSEGVVEREIARELDAIGGL